MSEDEGPDSDSSGREFRRRVMRPRSRRSKEARVCYSSRTTMSLQDPMPEYVDPELVKLIAQNAPFELDVFVRSLHKSNTKRRAESGGRCEGAANEGKQRPLAVEALLSSVRERNDHLSVREDGQEIRHSCPERIWSDYDETNEKSCRATAVKRKRPKSVDTSRITSSDRQCSSEASFRMNDNKGRGELRRARQEDVSANSSDEGPNCLEGECFPPLKGDAFDVSSVPARLPVGIDCDMLSAKPWRHGMRKGKRSVKDEKPPNASCCKRKAETDSRNSSEVRKYMETKMVERRKEQQQLKAEADAALATRREQQRKLDIHRQVAGAKSLECSPRPAWVSEYGSLCEPPRPWSSSSGELNTYLPPPVTPPNLEPVPLDLYATQLQYAEVQSSTPRVDRSYVQNSQAREKRRSKKPRGCSREVQRQLKYGRSESMKEFRHNELGLPKLVNSPVTRKATWKTKTKLRGRKVSSEEVQRQLFEHDEPYPQRRSGDLEVYKRSLERQVYNNGGTLSTAAKESRAQKFTRKFSTKTCIQPTRPAESSVKNVIKDQVRPLTKVKRLKANPHFVPSKAKELTGEELATLLNSNGIPSDCESETHVKLNGQVNAERMIVDTSQTSLESEQESITDLRKCVELSFGSPQKNSTDDVLSKWFGPSVEGSARSVIDEDVQHGSTGHTLDSLLKPSRSNGRQVQVLDFQKKKMGDTDIVRATSKNPTMAVRWQRMQLLKNLAEQLVKRVDAACAKKRQIEHSASGQIKSPSIDVNIEPSGHLPIAESGHADSLERKPKQNHLPSLNNGLPSSHVTGSLLGERLGQSELKFIHGPKQNSIINYRGLTEQEQAGSETPSVLPDEMQSTMKDVISSPKRADHKAVGGRVSEICTVMEWNTFEKGTDTICNNPSACPSFAPFSPSTSSSSPVVLPTSAKYHMGRIKHSKMVASDEKRRQPKKENWIIPAENDKYSFFNVCTRHLKDRERFTASTSPPVLQKDLANSTTEEIEIDPGIAGPSAEEDISNVASKSLSRNLTVSEFPLISPEPINGQTTRSTDCSHERTVSLVSDGKGSDLKKEDTMSPPNFGSLQKREFGSDKSAGRPPPELTNLKSDAIELAGLNPALTILEIGDVKVCQSPTSIHLRLERSKNNGEDRKEKEQKFVNISHVPNEAGGQCVRHIPPMKITYARQVRSKARPDDGCIDDERVIVELHQMNAEVPTVSLQGDTKLESPDLDASEGALMGSTDPRLNKVIGNAPSEIVETCNGKHSSVSEEDGEAYMLSKAKGNATSESIIDCGSEKILTACQGETRSPCTMLTCQKGELSIQLNRNSKFDPQIELRDSEEWELKLRRDQLEAELKKLDSEILKTRAKLHQRHPMMDSQVHSVSRISVTDHPVEVGFKLDKISNIQKRFTKRIPLIEKDSDVFEESSDLQKQKIVHTLFSLKSLRDGEKTVTSSNSYSDSFVSEGTETGQKIPGTGKCDFFPDHLRHTENIEKCGRSSREPKIGSQQFEMVLENMPDSRQCNGFTKKTEVVSHCKMPSNQDEFASEGSEISTGRRPGRRLDKPPEVDCNETAARCRIFKLIPATDEMVDIDVGGTGLCAKVERTTLQSHTVCGRDELLDASHDLVNAEEKSGRGAWTPLHSHSVPQPTEEKVIRRNKGQISLQQKGFGAGEILSSSVQCGAQTADNIKGLTARGRNDKSIVTAGIQISPGNTTPPCIEQNRWPMQGEKGIGQSNAFKQQAETQSHCKMSSTRDEFAREGSDISAGTGPGRRLDKPPEGDCEESTSRRRTSKVRAVRDQMAEARLLVKDERTVPQRPTVCSLDVRLDAVHNLVNAEEKSGRGPSIPLHSIRHQTEEKFIRRNEGQTSFQQTGRNFEELPAYGAGESPRSVVQFGAENSDNSKGLLPGERNDKSAVTASLEILPGNYTPACIRQNEWPPEGGKTNAVSCDLVEVPRGPTDDLQEGRIFHAAATSTLWSARTSEDGSDGLASIELSKLSQTIQDDIAFTRQTLASLHNTKTSLSAENLPRMVTAELRPFPLPPMGESEECIPVVPSLHHDLQTSQTPAELPVRNTTLSTEENGQIIVDDDGNRPTCSDEVKMSENAATTVSRFIHAVCLTPLNRPCASTTEEARWECLSLPSHMDFSTIKEKLRNSNLATDEHPITDGWSINSQSKSCDSPTSTTGGSSGGNTLASETIISDGPHKSKNFPESLSILEFQQAAKSKCSPEMNATQENSSQTFLSKRTESMDIKTDPNNNVFSTPGVVIPASSTRELPSFLPSLYFHQQTRKTDVSEDVESTISEDLDHFESDIDEELQDEVEGPSSGKFETTCTSLLPSSDFTSPIPDSRCCLSDRSPNVQVFHQESGLSVTNGLTSRMDHGYECISTDCFDEGPTGRVPEPCAASGMGSPSTMSPKCPESPLSLDAGGQKKSWASTGASPESSDGEVIEPLQSVRAASTEHSCIKDISRISNNFYCGSEVSGSHHQSGSISEGLPSDDSEISSNGSVPARDNIHSIDTVELSRREDINEEVGTQVGDDGSNHHCNAMTCNLRSEPDFMHDADKQHPGIIGESTTRAGIANQNLDMNFLHTGSVIIANFQGKAKSDNNSNRHPAHLASHHEPENSKPVELPLPTVLPPLRTSKHSKQYGFCNSLRFGKLSTKETHFDETLSNTEDQLSTKMSGLELESAFTEALTGTPSAAPLVAISTPAVMVKTLNTVFHCEQNNPGTVCTLDVTSFEGHDVPVQKTLDVEVICPSPHQMGPVQVSETHFLGDLAQKVECNSEDNSLAEELTEIGHLPSETYSSSKKFTAADLPLGNEKISVCGSGIAAPSHTICGYSGLGLEKAPHLDTERVIVSVPVDCVSVGAPTFTTKDTLDSRSYLTSTGNENQLLGERRITKIESNKFFHSCNGDKSTGGPPSSAHPMVRANRDILSRPETEDRVGPQSVPSRPDRIIAVQLYQASAFSCPSPLLGHQKIVIDVGKDSENQARHKEYTGKVDLNYTKTNAEFEAHADQGNSNSCSLQVVETDLPSQHGSMSDGNCSNKERFLSRPLEPIVRNGLAGVVPKVPIAEDLEACSSNRSSLIYMEEKEEVKCCEILEGEGRLVSYRISCSGGAPLERMPSTTCLATRQKAPSCAHASPKLDASMEVDVHRAEKLDIMTDLLTSMIYEDLLSVALSGLHQEVERTPTSLQISGQSIQSANVTKTLIPKSKQSRKVSAFCLVLKHFLSTGWRSASIRHKKGLFLHVEGLRPHPLNPTSRAMPGTLKFNVQYPNYRESNTQFLLLDLNDVYSYVQRLFELSSLILDPSPINWYDSIKPVGEHSCSALESQSRETGHIFGNSRWHIHKKLMLDLINETLLKQFVTKLPVPSFGMTTLPVPACGENLVQFVANEIVEHERHASKYGFDIEKVIAKAFEDEHWEKCSEEARDVVDDLAQGILCDLIERFVYEMVRG